MHGLSIAANLIEAVIKSLDDHPNSRVVQVEVEVGELLVDPEELEFVFQIAAKDTPVEGAELLVTKQPGSREIYLKKVKLEKRE